MYISTGEKRQYRVSSLSLSPSLSEETVKRRKRERNFPQMIKEREKEREREREKEKEAVVMRSGGGLVIVLSSSFIYLWKDHLQLLSIGKRSVQGDAPKVKQIHLQRLQSKSQQNEIPQQWKEIVYNSSVDISNEDAIWSPSTASIVVLHRSTLQSKGEIIDIYRFLSFYSVVDLKGQPSIKNPHSIHLVTDYHLSMEMGVGEITAISTVTSLSSSFSSLSPAMRKQPEGVFITTSHTPSSLSPSSPSPSPSPSPFPSPFPSSSPSPSPSPSSLSPTLLFIPFSRKNIAYEIPLSSSLLQLPSSSVEKSDVERFDVSQLKVEIEDLFPTKTTKKKILNPNQTKNVTASGASLSTPSLPPKGTTTTTTTTSTTRTRPTSSSYPTTSQTTIQSPTIQSPTKQSPTIISPTKQTSGSGFSMPTTTKGFSMPTPISPTKRTASLATKQATSSPTRQATITKQTFSSPTKQTFSSPTKQSTKQSTITVPSPTKHSPTKQKLPTPPQVKRIGSSSPTRRLSYPNRIYTQKEREESGERERERGEKRDQGLKQEIPRILWFVLLSSDGRVVLIPNFQPFLWEVLQPRLEPKSLQQNDLFTLPLQNRFTTISTHIWRRMIAAGSQDGNITIFEFPRIDPAHFLSKTTYHISHLSPLRTLSLKLWDIECGGVQECQFSQTGASLAVQWTDGPLAVWSSTGSRIFFDPSSTTSPTSPTSPSPLFSALPPSSAPQTPPFSSSASSTSPPSPYSPSPSLSFPSSSSPPFSPTQSPIQSPSPAPSPSPSPSPLSLTSLSLTSPPLSSLSFSKKRGDRLCWTKSGCALLQLKETHDLRLCWYGFALPSWLQCNSARKAPHAVYLTDRKILFLKNCSHTTLDEDIQSNQRHPWKIIQIPFDYLQRVFPVKKVCLSPCGQWLAIAGISGFALYSFSFSKWSFMRDNSESERSSLVVCDMSWSGHYFAILCVMQGKHQVLFFEPEMPLTLQYVHYTVLLRKKRNQTSLTVPYILDCNSTEMIVFTQDGFLYQYRIVTSLSPMRSCPCREGSLSHLLGTCRTCLRRLLVTNMAPQNLKSDKNRPKVFEVEQSSVIEEVVPIQRVSMAHLMFQPLGVQLLPLPFLMTREQPDLLGGYKAQRSSACLFLTSGKHLLHLLLSTATCTIVSATVHDFGFSCGTWKFEKYGEDLSGESGDERPPWYLKLFGIRKAIRHSADNFPRIHYLAKAPMDRMIWMNCSDGLKLFCLYPSRFDGNSSVGALKREESSSQNMICPTIGELLQPVTVFEFNPEVFPIWPCLDEGLVFCGNSSLKQSHIPGSDSLLSVHSIPFVHSVLSYALSVDVSSLSNYFLPQLSSLKPLSSPLDLNSPSHLLQSEEKYPVATNVGKRYADSLSFWFSFELLLLELVKKAKKIGSPQRSMVSPEHRKLRGALDLLRYFSSFSSRPLFVGVVGSAARKMGPEVWGTIFPYSGNPLSLFLECLGYSGQPSTTFEGAQEFNFFESELNVGVTIDLDAAVCLIPVIAEEYPLRVVGSCSALLLRYASYFDHFAMAVSVLNFWSMRKSETVPREGKEGKEFEREKLDQLVWRYASSCLLKCDVEKVGHLVPYLEHPLRYYFENHRDQIAFNDSVQVTKTIQLLAKDTDGFCFTLDPNERSDMSDLFGSEQNTPQREWWLFHRKCAQFLEIESVSLMSLKIRSCLEKFLSSPRNSEEEERESSGIESELSSFISLGEEREKESKIERKYLWELAVEAYFGRNYLWNLIFCTALLHIPFVTTGICSSSTQHFFPLYLSALQTISRSSENRMLVGLCCAIMLALEKN